LSALPYGLYEEVLSQLLRQQLSALDPSQHVTEDEPLDSGDSHTALAEYLKHVLARAFDSFDGEDRLAQQISLCNRIISLLHEVNPRALLLPHAVAEEARRLLAVLPKLSLDMPSLERPDTPLAFSCLLTGTRLDPSLVSQIKKEIRSADRIDVLCSFIKWSGLRVIEEELQAFTSRPGSSLRIITTSYMGATDLKAIEKLTALPNSEVKVSYDSHRTRLHAKAYIFHRQTGFGSGYVGSANLSHAAMTDGLEWNIKISQRESPHLWQKIVATFETYWNDSEFATYSSEERDRLALALREQRQGDGVPDLPFVFELHPYGFQQEILDRLDAERSIQKRDRHLIVAATGTGKTMIAAFDYRNWSRQESRSRHDLPRLLFIAHREEILRQSLATFRGVLRNHNFGELLVGGREPDKHDYLFASIQSYNSRGLSTLPADYYDYAVVDEFHHAAAASYEDLLTHLRPRVLLGLTATPERADGLDILRHFGHHISAEIRLPDAIDRKLLCPFQYFGITDAVDLAEVRWRRGGYAVEDLESKYTGNYIRVQLIVDKVRERLLDPHKARGLGFCVSIAHAEYMAEQFRCAGIPAEALSAESSDETRLTVQDRLRRLDINFIFVVDLYNEGVDIPEVDTVLFLRPTESLTVFLQQLGRGLRLHEEKDYLTVLDFIGQAHRSFRFDLRFRSLLTDPSASLIDQVEQDFAYLPAGCSIHLERKAREHILQNIRQAVRQSRQMLTRELATYAQGLGRRPSLSEFLEFFRLEPDDLYRREICWTRLCVEAGLREAPSEPDEDRLTKGLRRLQHIGGAPQIKRLLELLACQNAIRDDVCLDETSRRLLLMLHFSLWGRDWIPSHVGKTLDRLRRNPCMHSELVELMQYRLERIGTVPPALDLPFSCPLTLHAQYTRDEILAALGRWTLDGQPEMREGILHLPEIRTDVFLVTLNKTEREFSPSTMYQDYAISDDLFHWQSQSTTSPDSPTGKRYVEHRAHGHTILLFVREHKKTGGLSSPFYFLGPADYVSHEGSRPMSIVWQLRNPIPAGLLRRTARLVTV
jgi:superfamily II DNA or RNA helicase/HKD family nuclease